MFESLEKLPSDPLLGIMEMYLKDTNPQKIDLGVGVYKDELGQTPVLRAVKQAESIILQNQVSKSYLGAQGDRQFTESICKLALGEVLYNATSDRIVGLQTPGGCGALRVAAELLVRSRPNAKIWVSDPTWANHVPLLGSAGLVIETYPYYDYFTKSIRFSAMMDCLKSVAEGDLVLLHACCHNPCGADLSREQWADVVGLCVKRNLVPLVDMAYQGFGESLDSDAFGLRLIAEKLPESIFTVSCSKNFGLYRDRVGVVAFISDSSKRKEALTSNLVQIVRGIYSMPPDHGAAAVSTILIDPLLKQTWESELRDMRERIQKMRNSFAESMSLKGFDNAFEFVIKEQGMFSFLGITSDQVSVMAAEYGIYMASSSRINIAGLSDANLEYFCESLTKVVRL